MNKIQRILIGSLLLLGPLYTTPSSALAAPLTPGPSPSGRGWREAPGEGRTVYQCVMHPQIIRDAPGQCPICHMELQKVELSEPVVDDASVAGKAAFDLPPARQQLIGVKVQAAVKGSLSKSLRLAGRMVRGHVEAQLLEMDSGSVKPGLKAWLKGPAGQRVAARVAQVEDSLDGLTRSFGVLLTPAKREAWMRSGVYVEAQIELPQGRGLLVPADAVLQTGDQSVVFVRRTTSRFEPRRVQVGLASEDQVLIISGLSAGEEVVTAANFLIDSEARFKSAIEAFR